VWKLPSFNSGPKEKAITLIRLDKTNLEGPFHIKYSTKCNYFRLLLTKPSTSDLEEAQMLLDKGGSLFITHICSCFQEGPRSGRCTESDMLTGEPAWWCCCPSVTSWRRQWLAGP